MIRQGINQPGYDRDAHVLAMYIEESAPSLEEIAFEISRLAENYGTTFEIARENVISERTISDDERNTGRKPFPWSEI